MHSLERNITLNWCTISARTCNSAGSVCRRTAIISKFSLLPSPSNLEADSKVSTVLLPENGSKSLSAHSRRICRRVPSNSLPAENLDSVSDLTVEGKQDCQSTKNLYLDHVERRNNRA